MSVQPLERRAFVRLFAAIAAATACPACRGAQAQDWGSPWGGSAPVDRRPPPPSGGPFESPWPDQAPQRQQRPDERGARAEWGDGPVGCLVPANAKPGSPAARKLQRWFDSPLDSSGNAALDGVMYAEAELLGAMMGVAPKFGFYNDDDHDNAFSTPRHDIPGSAHGTILFGLNLLSKTLRNHGQSAVIGVMAHEWGHSLQFVRLATQVPGKPWELQADYLSGWYLGSKGNLSVEVERTQKQFFALGDFNYNAPGHHGTPAERLAAFTAGHADGGLPLAAAFERSRIRYRAG